MANLPLKLTVHTREKTLFDGEVKAVTSKNRKGIFDVLGLHANFITLVDEVLTVRRLDGRVQEIEISDGVMRVVANKIDIFLGIKVLAAAAKVKGKISK